jgi:cyclic beta-1,2-glucan synthetase
MQRVGVESILGVSIRDGFLLLAPTIPRDWPGFEVTITWRSACYVIMVRNPAGVSKGVVSVALDGIAQPATQALALADDGATHKVQVVLG